MNINKINKLTEDIKILESVEFKHGNWSCVILTSIGKWIGKGIIPIPGASPSGEGDVSIINELNDAIRPVLDRHIEHLKTKVLLETKGLMND